MTNEERVKRMEQLLELVQMRRGWSKRKLADYLGCDWRSMIRKNGDMSFLAATRVAKALDWPIDAVASLIDEPVHTGASIDASGLTFDQANQAATRAAVEGDSSAKIAYARRAYETATNPDDRALSCIREGAAWGSKGHYGRAQEAVVRGLSETTADSGLRLVLESFLAGTYLYLWKLREAGSMANGLASRIKERDTAPTLEQDATGHRACCARAQALYVAGQASRRMIQTDPANSSEHVVRGTELLDSAIKSHRVLAKTNPAGESMWLAISHTCAGAMLELAVEAAQLTAIDALQSIYVELDNVADPAKVDSDHWLESYGWWCVFGCNIALRHLSETDQQRPIAVLSNKAAEIAERLENWTLMERVFTLDFARQQRLAAVAQVRLDYSVDQGDICTILDLMGRFPTFRTTGWNILQSARIVADA